MTFDAQQAITHAISRCVQDDAGCFIWPGALSTCRSNPGACPSVRRDGRKINLRRLVFFGADIQDRSRLVVTTCGNNRCLRKDHLAMVAHARRDKSQPRTLSNKPGCGELYATKLTDEMRHDILKLHDNGLCQREIALNTGTSQSTVSRFLRGGA